MASFYGGRPGAGVDIYQCDNERCWVDMTPEDYASIPIGGYGVSGDGWLFKVGLNRERIKCGNVLLDRSSAAKMFSIEAERNESNSAIIARPEFSNMLKGGIIFRKVIQ